MSYPRVTQALVVLGLGVFALVGCTTQQEPAPTPTPVVTQAPARVLPTARLRPGLSLRLAGGDVGSATTLRVTGVACPGGQPLTVVWDTLGPVGQLEGVSEASQTYEIKITAPKDEYGSHPISVRCGLDGPLLANTRFLLTNSPVVTVDPISALPGTSLEINLTGFACANDFNRPETTVITWDGTPVTLPFSVPAATKPGRHIVLARCDWPATAEPPRAAASVWVPDIVSIKPTSGLAGTNVQVMGSGFACDEVTLDVDGTQVTRTAVRLDSQRQPGFTATVSVPIGTVPGPHEIGAACTDAGARPVAAFIVDGPTVAPSPSTRPEGGVQPVVWVGVGVLGLAVLAAMALATYLARRAVRPRPRRPGLRVQVGLGEPQVQVREAEERQ